MAILIEIYISELGWMEVDAPTLPPDARGRGSDAVRTNLFKYIQNIGDGELVYCTDNTVVKASKIIAARISRVVPPPP